MHGKILGVLMEGDRHKRVGKKEHYSLLSERLEQATETSLLQADCT